MPGGGKKKQLSSLASLLDPLHPSYLVLTHGNAFSPLKAAVLPWPFDFQSSDDSDLLFLRLAPLRPAAVLQCSHSCLLIFSLCLITGKNIVIKANGSKHCQLCFPLINLVELL